MRCFYFNAFLIEGNLDLDGESPASAARNVLFFFLMLRLPIILRPLEDL